MNDPYERYPERWRAFTLEQCNEMDREIRNIKKEMEEASEQKIQRK